MEKENDIYQLIQAMEPSEKAYFKKFSFKKRSKNSANFLLLFDLLDKQKKYSLEKISSHKKLPQDFHKNLYANLYILKKEVLANLREYNRANNKLSELFDMFLEYDIFKSKKLDDIAKKKIISIEKHIEKNNLFYFKPYLYSRMNEGLLNNISIKKEYKASQYEKYKDSIEGLYQRGQMNITASKFETLIEANGGLIFKDPTRKAALQNLRDELRDLLKYFADDFVAFGGIHNNLLMVNMILGDVSGIRQASMAYIEYYNNSKDTITNADKTKIFVHFKNIAYHNLVLNNTDVFEEIQVILKNERDNCTDATLAQNLDIYITNLKALFYIQNPQIKPTETEIETFKTNVQNLDKTTPLYYELLTATGIILANEKRYQESLDITSDIFLNDFTERINDSYVILKCVRAICWLKLEKLELFDSELNSIYKFLLKYQNFSFAKEIINFIKKSNSQKTKKTKVKVFKDLLSEFEKIQEEGTLLERMEATELKLVLKLALK